MSLYMGDLLELIISPTRLKCINKVGMQKREKQMAKSQSAAKGVWERVAQLADFADLA